jgi:hypothetical protein
MYAVSSALVVLSCHQVNKTIFILPNIIHEEDCIENLRIRPQNNSILSH